jgi:hypothetical protein
MSISGISSSLAPLLYPQQPGAAHTAARAAAVGLPDPAQPRDPFHHRSGADTAAPTYTPPGKCR